MDSVLLDIQFSLLDSVLQFLRFFCTVLLFKLEKLTAMLAPTGKFFLTRNALLVTCVMVDNEKEELSSTLTTVFLQVFTQKRVQFFSCYLPSHILQIEAKKLLWMVL